ncbi:hypothetical protein E4U42_000507 [Claviceps africana]|uniref:Cyanovirin-N domain-containing protein n=1 Tax=Claviceps africana TaxID=83212 RepID=A0A8K0JAB2_9HYPO|nr:hypothetical protein E4U42_000507 [Claviceps africana]
MHLSSILASLAVLAGQAAAATCSAPPAGMQVLSPCLDGNLYTWKCDSAGSVVGQVQGGKYFLQAQSRAVAVQAYCARNPQISVSMQCPPNTRGFFNLNCLNYGGVAVDLLI